MDCTPLSNTPTVLPIVIIPVAVRYVGVVLSAGYAWKTEDPFHATDELDAGNILMANAVSQALYIGLPIDMANAKVTIRRGAQ